MSGEQAQPPPASAAKLERNQLFISYSHRDREWVDRLRTMLLPLEQRYGLDRWDDSRIPPGALWGEEIEKALARAQVALLMVSADFLASDFVTRSELPPLFHAAKQEGLRILWVPLRPCLWRDIPEIEQYQAVIPPDRTVAKMTEVEQEEAFVQIAEVIKRVFQEEAQLRVREKAERERQEVERQAHEKQERQREEKERLAREKEDRERQEAERAAREQQERRRREEERDANARKTPAEPCQPIPSPWPESSAPPLPGGTERSGFGPLVMATIRREGSTWVIQRQAIETWGFRERLAEGVELKMVAIPTGSFLMGSLSGEEKRGRNEGPQHEVRLEGFFIAQTPITQAQWKVVAGWDKVELDLNPDPSNFKGLNRPVDQVEWHEAVEFCRRLSQHTGRRYGLPSEAQWEYACRAGTTTPFAFGATITTELANYNGNSTYGDGPKGSDFQQTTDVGSFCANAWGLHDMHGNVWEWCMDHWHKSYSGAPADGRPWVNMEETQIVTEERAGLLSFLGPKVSVHLFTRVRRGGSWRGTPGSCRSAYRISASPNDRYSSIGFRICCLPPRRWHHRHSPRPAGRVAGGPLFPPEAGDP